MSDNKGKDSLKTYLLNSKIDSFLKRKTLYCVNIIHSTAFFLFYIRQKFGNQKFYLIYKFGGLSTIPHIIFSYILN